MSEFNGSSLLQARHSPTPASVSTSRGQVEVLTLTCRLLLVSSEHLQLLLQVPDVEQLTQVVT